MAKITITEALQERKTILARIDKQEQNVIEYLTRRERERDPMEAKGGSVEYIKATRQSIDDLRKRYLSIGVSIQKANAVTNLEIGEKSRTISEWLSWRRDIAPGEQMFLAGMINNIAHRRTMMERTGGRLVEPGAATDRWDDLRVNVSEADLRQQAEDLDALLSTMDGRLSLINATTIIEIPD